MRMFEFYTDENGNISNLRRAETKTYGDQLFQSCLKRYCISDDKKSIVFNLELDDTAQKVFNILRS